MSTVIQPTVFRALSLFGTLALCSAANAAFSFSSAYVELDAGGVTVSSFDTSVTGTGLAAIGANSSLTLSAFTSSGFTLSATSDGSEIWSVFGSTFGFSVDEAMTVVLSGTTDSSSATVYLIDNTTSAAMFVRGSGSGPWTSGEITLAAGGSYLVGVNGPLTFANGGTETGTVLDFMVVPAPAAASLLVLAGLSGARSRRHR